MIDTKPTTSDPEEKLESEGKSSGLEVKAEQLETLSRPSTESTQSSVPRESIDLIRYQTPEAGLSSERPSSELADTGLSLKTPAEYDILLKQLQADFETSELQKHEEIHGYIERIDALQAKLQYLAKESAEASRKASDSAPAGSLEKKLADKEEQVALLMEEGQKLSKKELTHLTTIKKLRAKIQEDNKELTEVRKKQEKAEKDAALAADRLKRAENSEKQVNEKQRQILQLQKEIESLKAAGDSKDVTIADLRSQLEEAVTQGKQAELKLTNESLELERKKVAELEENIANMKIEKDLVADRAQAQIKELREKMEKDSERARVTELEMKSEQQMLESKLEVMRARAEEVSTGATGDAQAKLLRQIETLQTQYVVASENWQGIEASLIARATSLEKERDEATRREADIRRKAREVVSQIRNIAITPVLTSIQTLKVKRNEDELEELRPKLPSLQQELAAQKAQLDSLQQRAKEAEAALIEARAAFDQERQAWQSELLQRIDEERQKWQEETAGQGFLSPGRVDSPLASPRRGFTPEFLGFQTLPIRGTTARSITSDVPTADRFQARRPSAVALGRSSGGNGNPTRQDLFQSVTANTEVPDTPSIHTDQDDFFENNASLSSPHQTINDMVSASTAGAGPSVQLVERMSSAVRRLESEKVATKEDIARLSAQRDEARAEIVALMKEVEAKKAVDARVAELEAEVEEIKARYETTLEMLGEKSELVDELRSDIDDIKAMYRELVERTVK